MRRFMPALFVLAICSSFAFAGQAYTVDRSNSQAKFFIRHVVETVEGTFNDISGTIAYDESDLAKSKVRVVIKVASVNTHSWRRDSHLKSADFFDVAAHPDTVFESQRIEKRGTGYVAIGNLTMHGVTKPLEIPFTLTFAGNEGARGRMSIRGTTQLNRRDYGVSYNEIVDNMATLGDDVRIELSLQATLTR